VPTAREVLQAIDDFELAAQWCVATGKPEGNFWQMDRAYYDGRYPDTVVVEWLELDGPLYNRSSPPERVAWPVHLEELMIERDPVLLGLWKWQRERASGRL
jgi:hypothetical protein